MARPLFTPPETYSRNPLLPKLKFTHGSRSADLFDDKRPGWWNPWRARLPFPCPVCFHPLAGVVEPEMELECPICRASFRIPARPVSRTDSAPVMAPAAVTLAPKSSGWFGQFLFAMGVMGFGAGVALAVFGVPYGLALAMAVFWLGVFSAWASDQFKRRKNPALAKKTKWALAHEGFQSIGAMALGLLVIAGLVWRDVPLSIFKTLIQAFLG